MRLMRTRYLIVTLLCVTAACVILGGAYWGGYGNLPHCLYASNECSLAIATYILCLCTAAAFLAAYAAARWALGAYQLEQSVILVQRTCNAEKHEALIELTCDFTAAYRGKPSLDEAFLHLDYELESLGRSAVVDEALELHATFNADRTPDTRPDAEPVESAEVAEFRTLLPPIHLKADGSAHLRIYIPHQLVNAGICVTIEQPKRKKKRTSPTAQFIGMPRQRMPYSRLEPLYGEEA